MRHEFIYSPNIHEGKTDHFIMFYHLQPPLIFHVKLRGPSVSLLLVNHSVQAATYNYAPVKEYCALVLEKGLPLSGNTFYFQTQLTFLTLVVQWLVPKREMLTREPQQ